VEEGPMDFVRLASLEEMEVGVRESTN
jgi:hypothetical protein